MAYEDWQLTDGGRDHLFIYKDIMSFGVKTACGFVPKQVFAVNRHGPRCFRCLVEMTARGAEA